MFIDIHAHAYRKRAPFSVPFCTAEELISEFDRLQIEKGCVLPIVSPEIYFPQTNEDILDMAEENPGRLIPFCNVDPRALTNAPTADFTPVLQYYKNRGCRGLGEVMPNMPLMDPRVQNLLFHAEIVGLPVIFDGSDQQTGDFGLYDDPGLPQLEHTLQRFPHLKLFGHGPVFWSEIAPLETPGERGYVFDLKGRHVGRLPQGKIAAEGVVPKLFRKYPNLFGDLSDPTAYNALARDEEFGPRFVEEFQDRLCFGTDMCFVGMEVALPELLLSWRAQGKISESAFQKVARENAIRIFNL